MRLLQLFLQRDPVTKKYTVQSIYPRAGETQPHLGTRFADGKWPMQTILTEFS